MSITTSHQQPEVSMKYRTDEQYMIWVNLAHLKEAVVHHLATEISISTPFISGP